MKKMNAIIYTNNFCTVLHNAGFTKRGAEKNARRFVKRWLKNNTNMKGERLVRIELREPVLGSFDGELIVAIEE